MFNVELVSKNRPIYYLIKDIAGDLFAGESVLIFVESRDKIEQMEDLLGEFFIDIANVYVDYEDYYELCGTLPEYDNAYICNIRDFESQTLSAISDFKNIEVKCYGNVRDFEDIENLRVANWEDSNFLRPDVKIKFKEED